jgi:protein-S-isoprenylcysteine O-methyltransferase Ste14
MSKLELKVIPPFVALLAALLTWLIARLTPGLEISHMTRSVVALGFCGVAVVLLVLALLAFRQHKTTYHPQSVNEARALVTGGVFNYSRNPMYLAMALGLAGWAVYLASPFALLGLVFFVAYIQRFQIVPEERALAAKFGESYGVYRQRVRRWL